MFLTGVLTGVASLWVLALVSSLRRPRLAADGETSILALELTCSRCGHQSAFVKTTRAEPEPLAKLWTPGDVQ